MYNCYGGRRSYWWIPGGILLFVGLAFLFGWVVQSLWNALIPHLFHGPVLSYWQAVGLLVLTHLLFRGGSHFGGHHHKRWHSHGGWSHHLSPEEREQMKLKWEEKLAAMPPEQRAKYEKRWGWWCCDWEGKGEDK